MTYSIPDKPENSFRIKLELENKELRLDTILLDALQKQNENEELKHISKTQLKKLFTNKRVYIKGQNAKANSSINSGISYIDILL